MQIVSIYLNGQCRSRTTYISYQTVGPSGTKNQVYQFLLIDVIYLTFQPQKIQVSFVAAKRKNIAPVFYSLRQCD